MTDRYAVEGECDWNLTKEVPITSATTDKLMKDVFGSKDVHITLVRTVLGSRIYTKKNRKLKCSGL